MDSNTTPKNSDPSRSLTKKFTDASCLLLIHNEFESEGLRGVLANRGMKSIRLSSNLAAAVKTMSCLKPDVVIVDDWDFTDDPTGLFASIRKRSAGSEIILLFDELSLNKKYLSTPIFSDELGFVGIKLLLRATIRDGDRMAAIIDQVLLGHDSVESDVVDVFVRNVVRHSESLAKKLTKRELQVLELAGNGAINKSIASQLNTSPAYVGNILTQIFSKLGFHEDPNINPRVAACREFFQEYGFGETG